MAATARVSHVRETSITRLESDVNPNFTFPPQAHERSLSNTFQFPPLQFSSNEHYTFPHRRGCVPLNIAEACTKPRTSTVDAFAQLTRNSSAMDTCETSLPSPDSPEYTSSSPKAGGPPTSYYTSGRPAARTVGAGVSPTVLSASVRLGPVPTKASLHSKEASELLKVPPMLDSKLEVQEQPSLSPAKKVVPPPPSGVHPRRGHAHRRSGAISSSDVWSLMNQSAPALPIPVDASKRNSVNFDGSSPGLSPAPSPRLSSSAPVSPGLTAEALQLSPDAATLAQGRNSRVSFIEKVEVIPRPLSSGKEASSMRTVKAHVGSDSISSSIVSPRLSIDTTIRIPSPTRRPHNRTRSNSQTLTLPTAALRAQSDRPSTAGAILTSPIINPAKEEQASYFPDVPSSQTPISSSPYLDGITDTLPARKPSGKRTHKKTRSDFSPLTMSSEFDAPNKSDPNAEGGKKKKKKNKKKVKNWAGNILGKGKLKNSKRHHKSPKRSPTPPLQKPENGAPGEYEWVATSWNESYVMMPVDTSPNLEVPKVAVTGGQGSPVIDLDAALGPFKTPAPGSTAANLAAARRRRMHSSGGRGSAGYFHRRSESMPEMQLFALEEDEDRPMEDVFEEEEEEGGDFSDDSGSDTSGDEEEGQINGGDGLGIGMNSDCPSWSSQEGSVTDSDESEDGDKRLSMSTVTTENALVVARAGLPPSSRRKAAPADIITPNSEDLSASPLMTPSFSVPLDSPSTFHTASSNLNTPIQSEFPGDDSFTRFNPYLDYLGEPGPEMRMSVDDIPSLTSSSSTMTMSAIYAGMPSTPSTHEMMMGTSSLKGSAKEKKEKGKRWSRIWTFWKTK